MSIFFHFIPFDHSEISPETWPWTCRHLLQVGHCTVVQQDRVARLKLQSLQSWTLRRCPPNNMLTVDHGQLFHWNRKNLDKSYDTYVICIYVYIIIILDNHGTSILHPEIWHLAVHHRSLTASDDFLWIYWNSGHHGHRHPISVLNVRTQLCFKMKNLVFAATYLLTLKMCDNISRYFNKVAQICINIAETGGMSVPSVLSFNPPEPPP